MEQTTRSKSSNSKRPLKEVELIVALDNGDQKKADRMLETLSGLPVLWKVGPEMLLDAGPDWVKGLVRAGKRVFLDLKFHDIPNTVSRSCLQAADMGVEMLTVHLAGGPKMIQMVREDFDRRNYINPPKIWGVSVLTSFDKATWEEVSFAIAGTKSPVADSVRRLVLPSRFWGVDGVVCSALELPLVKKLDPLLLRVVPGIRPKGTDHGDQARVVTPTDAKKKGAHFIVVGRPITESANPREMTEKILNELSQSSKNSTTKAV